MIPMIASQVLPRGASSISSNTFFKPRDVFFGLSFVLFECGFDQLRQITNPFAKSSEHCLRAHVAWLTKSGAEQAGPAMTGRIATMDEDRISGTARNVGG